MSRQSNSRMLVGIARICLLPELGGDIIRLGRCDTFQSLDFPRVGHAKWAVCCLAREDSVRARMEVEFPELRERSGTTAGEVRLIWTRYRR